MGACGRGGGYVIRGQAYALDGDMWQGKGHGRVWGHVAGCGGMWQGVVVCGSGSGLWHRWGHVVGWVHVVGCGGHVAGCGGMWQGVGDVVGVRHLAWMGICGRGGNM